MKPPPKGHRSTGPYLVFAVLDERTVWRNAACLDGALAEWWDLIDLQSGNVGRHVTRVLDSTGVVIVDFGPYGLAWTDEVAARHEASEEFTMLELFIIELEVLRCP